MIRIKPDKCGYTRFTCSGIPKMPLFTPTANPDRDNLYAEFDKLPLKVKGMVFVADTIDMDWTDSLPVEVPELTCRSDLDPFSDSIDVSAHPEYIPANISGTTVNYPVHGGTSGFIDLFHKSNYASKVYFVVGSTTYGNIGAVSSLPTFDSTQILEPGMLEPMLDTDFKPINIDTITNVEAIIDGLDFSFINLNNWKTSIDDRIKNLYSVVTTSIVVDTDLRDLTREEYKESECDNFQILLADGDPLKTVDDWNVTSQTTVYGYTVGQVVGGATVAALWSELVGGTTVYYCATEREPNTYTITEGSIKIGEYYVTVPAVTGIIAPFYAYLTTGPLDTSHQAVATYAEVPTVEEDGQTVKIHNGSVMPDGGVVANFTHTTENTYTWDVCYDHTISAFGQINILNGMDLNEYGTADPPAGGIGIGGVRLIAGGTGDDSYLMYKIYHEDCITSAPLADGTAIVNNLYPSEVPEQNGPENPAGIVYPYDHIVSGTTGSTRLNWGRSAYVPTVTATYKFIHSESYGTDSISADQALAYAYVIQGGHSTDTDTWDVPIATDISLPELYRDKAAAATAVITPAYTDYQVASAAYDTAEADYEDAEAAWIAAGSPTDPSDPNYATYTAYQEAQHAMTAAGVTAENARINYNAIADAATCVVTGGTPGTVFAIDNMVYSNGVVLGAGVPSVTVPSVNAVHNYIHSAGALNFWGTYVPGENNSPAHISHGTPGTVFTVDWIDRDICLSGGSNSYYYSEVPTVFAVVDYVDGQLGAPAVPGIIVLTTTGTGTGAVETESVEDIPVDPPGTPTPHDSGTVQNVENILVGGTPSVSMQALPTVKAVYDFVHYEPVEGGTFSDPLADLGTMTAHAAVEYQPAVAEDLTANPPVAAQAEVPAQAASVSFAGRPGTCRVADNIETVVVSTQNGDVTLTAPGCVPTAQAVVDYVLSVTPGNTPNSVSGELTIGTDGNNNTEETWIDTQATPAPTRGTVEVAKGILVATDPGSRNLTPQAVASVDAVYTFVHSSAEDAEASEGSTQALAFRDVITVAAGSNNTESESAGNAVPGTTYVVNNIQVATTRSYSEKSVPTVEAIYDFIHNAGPGGPGEPIAKALATPGAMEEHAAVAAVTADPNANPPVEAVEAQAAYVSVSGEPGTVKVASDIVCVTGTLTTAQDCVPTAQAVVNYVAAQVPGATPDAVAANITVNKTTDAQSNATYTEAFVPGTNPTRPVRGTVQVAENILVGDTPTLTRQAAASVNAVYSFVHSTLTDVTTGDASHTHQQALGTPGTIKVSSATPLAEGWKSGDTGTPGTARMAKNICIKDGSISTASVPTTKAVYDFVHSREISTGANSELSEALATGASITAPADTGTTASLASGAIPGTCYVVTDMLGMRGSGVTLNTTYTVGTGTCTLSSVVPTVEAVKAYVDAVTGTASAVRGALTVGSHTVDGVQVNEEYLVNESSTITYVKGIVYVQNKVETARVDGKRVISKNAPPSAYAVYQFIHNTEKDASTSTTLTQALASTDAIVVSGSPTGETAPNIVPGTTYVASNIQVATARSFSTYSAPTVEAVYNFIHNPGPGGAGKTIAKALATGQTITAPVGEGNTVATLASGAVPGTCFVVTDMLGMTGSGVTLNTSYTVDGTSCTLESVVPTVAAVKGYVDANAGGSMAVLGHLTVDGSGDESLVAVTGGSTPAAGKLYVSENIDYSSTANKQIQSKLTVPNVIAVDEYTHGAKAKATAGTMTGTTSISLSGGTPGTVAVASNILTATGSTTTADCVPTAQAVVDYVENHSGGGTGEGVPWPNYAALGSSSGLLWVRTNYRVTVGGWLRISFRGNRISGCYSVTINNTQIGMMQMSSEDTGQFGQTFFMPIQAGSVFWVEFPSTGTRIWFDGVCENAVTGDDERHSETLHAAIVGSTDSYGSFDSSAAATEAENAAQNAVNRAHSAANYAADYATDAAEYAGYASNYSTEASDNADLAVAATTEEDAADYYWQTYYAVDSCSSNTARARDYARYARREANDAVNAVRDAQAASRWTSADLSSYVEDAEEYKDAAVASAEEAEGYNDDATADLAAANASLARALAAVRAFDPDFGV